MTPRQACEAERIQYRFGKVRVRDAADDLVVVEVFGAVASHHPYVQLTLNAHGAVVQRESVQHLTLSVFDTAVLAEIRRGPEWEYGAGVALMLGEDRVDRVNRSLGRLMDLGYVEVRGVSRDRMWRHKPT